MADQESHHSLYRGALKQLDSRLNTRWKVIIYVGLYLRQRFSSPARISDALNKVHQVTSSSIVRSSSSLITGTWSPRSFSPRPGSCLPRLTDE
jgi:hypothetical protein